MADGWMEIAKYPPPEEEDLIFFQPARESFEGELLGPYQAVGFWLDGSFNISNVGGFDEIEIDAPTHWHKLLDPPPV